MIPLRDDNPTRSFALVTYTLVAGCLVVFFWQLSLGSRFEDAVLAYGLRPAALLDGRVRQPIPAELTILTSMFLHGGWMHLLGNMLYLWIFGDNVEDRLGRRRFAAFYLLCGGAAALAQAIPDPHSRIPMVGASGAISGVLGAYLLLWPRAQVLVLLPLGPFSHLARLPALAVLGLWFLLQLLSNTLAPAAAGVAFRAHIGGFVAGMVLLPLLLPRRRRRV